mmetsp:Transcript_41353/g.128535  ORF Transcript_41353/g.128535 Transcript_41353/m.128535 type:complete len:203 (+) Transcript_41353:517-1125(+)
MAVRLARGSTKPGYSTALYGCTTFHVVSSSSFRTKSASVRQLSTSESRSAGETARRASCITSGCVARPAKPEARPARFDALVSWTVGFGPSGGPPPHSKTAERSSASWSSATRSLMVTMPVLSSISSWFPTLMPSIISEKSWKTSVSPAVSASATKGARSRMLRYLPLRARKAYCVSIFCTAKRSSAPQYRRVETSPPSALR